MFNHVPVSETFSSLCKHYVVGKRFLIGFIVFSALLVQLHALLVFIFKNIFLAT